VFVGQLSFGKNVAESYMHLSESLFNMKALAMPCQAQFTVFLDNDSWSTFLQIIDSTFMLQVPIARFMCFQNSIFQSSPMCTLGALTTAQAALPPVSP